MELAKQKPQSKEEIARRMLSGIRDLRADNASLRDQLHAATSELSLMKQNKEVVLAKLRQENLMLREQVDKLTQDRDHHQRWALELVTKCNDLEMFLMMQLGELVDHANTTANSFISGVNSKASSIKTFVDDLHKKGEDGAYRPLDGEPPKLAPVLSAEENQQVAKLGSKFAPKNPERL
jgi:predicted nuclease with TOPRIM domain